MNLKQLNAFIHVANTGSVSQSAKDLGLSQPTLSRHIA
ncbi:LysR family transcriptional regulator [Moraxella bovoculi]